MGQDRPRRRDTRGRVRSRVLALVITGSAVTQPQAAEWRSERTVQSVAEGRCLGPFSELAAWSRLPRFSTARLRQRLDERGERFDADLG